MPNIAILRLPSTAQGGRRIAAYVRKKGVGHYEYYQLVENRRVDGKPRQKVLVHLGSHATVESALTEWPQEIKRLRRFAQRKREEAERLSEDPATMTIRRTTLERAEKAERRADSLETNLKKLRELKKQGVV